MQKQIEKIFWFLISTKVLVISGALYFLWIITLSGSKSGFWDFSQGASDFQKLALLVAVILGIPLFLFAGLFVVSLAVVLWQSMAAKKRFDESRKGLTHNP